MRNPHLHGAKGIERESCVHTRTHCWALSESTARSPSTHSKHTDGGRQYPIVNAAYDSSGAIKYNAEINVAMAVALDGGLITPTLRNANKMDIVSLGARWRELVKKAQEKRLAPDEYSTGG